MIKTALKTYRKNIWSVFATTGIVALGVLVALIVAAPTIYYLLYYNVFRIISAASSLTKSGFDVTAFIESISRQLNGINWRDPINAVQSMLNVDSIVHLFKQALIDSGFQEALLQDILKTVNECANEIVAGVKDELIFMVTCVGASCVLAFIASRVVIQRTTAADKSFKKFIIVFFLNLGTVLLGYLIVIGSLFLFYMPVGGFIVLVLFVLLVVLFLTFLWPAIFYRPDNVKFLDLFNIKTILWYLLASLMVLGISLAVIGLAFLISDVIGLVIALPLIFVTNIIMENIMIHYTINYNQIKAEKKHPHKSLKAKLAKKRK